MKTPLHILITPIWWFPQSSLSFPGSGCSRPTLYPWLLTIPVAEEETPWTKTKGHVFIQGSDAGQGSDWCRFPGISVSSCGLHYNGSKEGRGHTSQTGYMIMQIITNSNPQVWLHHQNQTLVLPQDLGTPQTRVNKVPERDSKFSEWISTYWICI